MRNLKWLLLAPAFALLMAPTGGPTGGFPSKPKFQAVTVSPTGAAMTNQPAWGTPISCVTSASPALNCISGSVQQNVLYTGANGSFPTGVTGYGQVSATGGGNQAFGMFARCDLYTNGVCTNEFDSFNFSTHEPTGALPPTLGFGSADWNAIAFQVAAYGNNSSSIGFNVATGTQPFLAGLYVNPGAVKTYGAYIGAPTTGGIGLQVNGSPVGSNAPIQVNGGNCAACVGMQVQGGFTGSGNTALVAFTDVNNTSGVNLLLTGNGATTPKKFLRVLGGNFQLINNAYANPIFTALDDGSMTLGSAPTGGSKGAGTLNVGATLWQNGLQVAKTAAGGVTNAGSCVVAQAVLNFSGTCTFNSTGSTTVTFAAGFALAPACQVTITGTVATTVSASVNVLSTTQATVTTGLAGVATNEGYFITCVGT